MENQKNNPIEKLSLEDKLEIYIDSDPERKKKWDSLNHAKGDELKEKLLHALFDEYFVKGKEPSDTILLLTITVLRLK